MTTSERPRDAEVGSAVPLLDYRASRGIRIKAATTILNKFNRINLNIQIQSQLNMLVTIFNWATILIKIREKETLKRSVSKTG